MNRNPSSDIGEGDEYYKKPRPVPAERRLLSSSKPNSKNLSQNIPGNHRVTDPSDGEGTYDVPKALYDVPIPWKQRIPIYDYTLRTIHGRIEGHLGINPPKTKRAPGSSASVLRIFGYQSGAQTEAQVGGNCNTVPKYVGTQPNFSYYTGESGGVDEEGIYEEIALGGGIVPREIPIVIDSELSMSEPKEDYEYNPAAFKHVFEVIDLVISIVLLFKTTTFLTSFIFIKNPFVIYFGILVTSFLVFTALLIRSIQFFVLLEGRASSNRQSAYYPSYFAGH